MSARSWLVALEVGEDDDGPALDGQLLARRLEAVGQIRPVDNGLGRHCFLLRLDGERADDALVAAIDRFRATTADTAPLLAARLVQPEPSAPSPPPAGHAIPWRRLSTIAGVVLLLVAAVLVDSSQRGRDTPSPTPAAVVSAKGVELLPAAAFRGPSAKRHGLASGLTAWGASTASVVTWPADGTRPTQRVRVATGQAGGVWFEMPASPSTSYHQSAVLALTELSPGSRGEMILEWYGPTGGLLGYRTVEMPRVDTALASRVQTAVSPPGTARLRFLVNLTHGGAFVLAAAELRGTARDAVSSP